MGRGSGISRHRPRVGVADSFTNADVAGRHLTAPSFFLIEQKVPQNTGIWVYFAGSLSLSCYSQQRLISARDPLQTGDGPGARGGGYRGPGWGVQGPGVGGPGEGLEVVRTAGESLSRLGTPESP